MNKETIIRTSGVYDVVIMLPFAIPGVVEWVMKLLHEIHLFMGMSGSFPAFQAFDLFFINVFAILTVIYSVLRIQKPCKKYLMYDTIARFWIAATMMVYLTIYGISQIIWIFFLIEILWGAVQLYIYYKK